jgi:transposase
MHVAIARRQHKDKVYETVLLRRSYREDGKVKNETLANLTALPAATIELIRQSLAGKAHVVAGEGFDVARSLPHGHVAAVWAQAKALGFPQLLGPACTERDLALALIVARVCAPASKLATSRWWADTTLAVDLGVDQASSDEVYSAMDWLVARQDRIEATLANKHLRAGSLVYYDLSSSWVEGRCCPLAARGYSRDRKGGKAQIEYGLLTDEQGCPVSVEVFAGNTADPTAFMAAVDTIRTKFNLAEVVMVGDRGMITSARIEALKDLGGLSWITSLRAPAIKALVEGGMLQLSLFDEANLAEITHPDYPGERLIACRNPALAAERSRKRDELLAATEKLLTPIKDAVDAARLVGADKIGVRAGRAVNRYKMAKHFALDISHDAFEFSPKTDQITAEAALDGIYVIRTNVAAERLDAAATIEAYKELANVERDFRSLKAIDLDLRPIYHHLEDRVRAHVLICMLAGYLVWHLRRAWAPLCFTDEQPPPRPDPVGPATVSPAAKTKASTHQTVDGDAAHHFASLLHHLATMTRNTIVFAGGHHIDKLATPTPTQRRAFELLGATIPIRLTP